jgi:hypothetical protein
MFFEGAQPMVEKPEGGEWGYLDEGRRVIRRTKRERQVQVHYARQGNPGNGEKTLPTTWFEEDNNKGARGYFTEKQVLA